jgi:hypothetical protein
MLFLGELDVVDKGRINDTFKDLPHSLYNVLAVLTCIDDPTDGLLKLVTSSLRFIETTLTIKVKHLLDDPQNIEQETPL